MAKQELPFTNPRWQCLISWLWDGTQDILLHDLLWQRGQTDRPVVPWTLFPAFLVDGCHTGQPSDNWDLPSQPGLLVNDGMWLMSTSTSSFSVLG